jgi:RhoGAP domain
MLDSHPLCGAIGLRSSRLLRPPSHAPIPPTDTDTNSPGRAQSTTHHFPELVASFNSEPKYGDDVDLALASLDDVSALLLTYLDCLPGGIIPVWVRDVLGDAVGIYEEGYRDGGSESVRERRRAIRVAQLVLRLLPAAYFSLLVYLLAFLSQIPLYEAWNGWNVRGVARAFARVVVGVGSGASNRDEKGKCKENGMDARHRDDDVDWVAEEEDAVEVLEWLLVNWDDLSDGLFLGAPRETSGRRDSEAGRQQEGKGGIEVDKDATIRQPVSPHVITDNNTTTIVSSNAVTTNPSVNALLARITFLENKDAEWQWLQAQHGVELHHIFQNGEEKIGELEEALRGERNARARAEEALIKERMANANSQTSIEDAVRAERTMWVQEVQVLRKAWERLGTAWDSIAKERDGVGSIVEEIVGCSMGTSKEVST